VSNKYTDAVFKTTFPDTTVSIGNQPPKKIKGLTIKAIAYALAWRTNERGYCWPSYKRIAKDACCDYMTAVRGVRALLKLQVIGEFPSTRSRYDNTRYDGRSYSPKKSNMYILWIDMMEQLPTATDEDGEQLPQEAEQLPTATDEQLPQEAEQLPTATRTLQGTLQDENFRKTSVHELSLTEKEKQETNGPERSDKNPEMREEAIGEQPAQGESAAAGGVQ